MSIYNYNSVPHFLQKHRVVYLSSKNCAAVICVDYCTLARVVITDQHARR